MDPHFRAFSFVDRITSLQPGKRITGRFAIPPGIESFSNSLVAEAVGQLAAWAAMSALDFTHRPVAGLAGRVELLSTVRPGQTLELTAELESVDPEAVAYGGIASADGQMVLRLQDCVGPMMPLADFDDPLLVRERFTLLAGEGALPGGFRGVPEIELTDRSMISETALRAALAVPGDAEFFADHFPRRPVFPGTLLTHANLQLAVALMDTVAPPASAARWLPTGITDVKLRSFIAPGELLDLEARQREGTDIRAAVALQIRASGKRVGSCGVDLIREAAE